MLGLAYLQVQGAKFTMSSYSRTQATILAADMMDKAKLHGQAAVNVDAAAACDPLSVDPAVDKRCWLDRVAGTLPQGNAETTINGTTLEIRIAWQDRTTRSDGTPGMSAPVDRELLWSIDL
jgi:Tfp pilus assembly protein PilV